jgi:sucrose phosphorylase
VLKVRFPDGTEQLLEYFYQQIAYNPLTVADLQNIVGLSKEQVLAATTLINNAIAENQDFVVIDFKELHAFAEILQVVEQKRSYLGQMDVNASSPLVWDFYEET